MKIIMPKFLSHVNSREVGAMKMIRRWNGITRREGGLFKQTHYCLCRRTVLIFVKNKVRYWTYCLMPNHIHLIVAPIRKVGLNLRRPYLGRLLQAILKKGFCFFHKRASSGVFAAGVTATAHTLSSGMAQTESRAEWVKRLAAAAA